MPGGSKRKRIGGSAKTITLTLDEWGNALDHVFELGVQSGMDAQKRIDYIPPACPMCALKADHDALARRLAIKESSEAERRGGRRFA